MERVVTGGVDSFIMLDAIVSHDSEHMVTRTRLDRAPVWLAVECMAQAAALHLRAALDFGRHAFLLGVREVVFAAESGEEARLCGVLECSVIRTGETEAGAGYTVACHLLPVEKGVEGVSVARGELLCASVPYSPQFPEAVLRPRYERLFQVCTREG